MRQLESMIKRFLLRGVDVPDGAVKVEEISQHSQQIDEWQEKLKVKFRKPIVISVSQKGFVKLVIQAEKFGDGRHH